MLSKEKAFLLSLGFEVTQILDEAKLVSLIDELGELGIRFTRPFSNETPDMVISCIKSLGIEAADKNMKSGVLNATASLGLIAKEAANSKEDKPVSEIILALKLLGKKAAENYMFIPLFLVAISIKEIAKEAARNKMEKEVILSQISLKELYNFSVCSENLFKNFNKDFSLLFKDIEGYAQEESLETAVKHARILQNNF